VAVMTYQKMFAVNVLLVIVGTALLGHYVYVQSTLPPTSTGDTSSFLESLTLQMLSQDERKGLLCMHDEETFVHDV